ncbi:MAG: 4-(cytidine 5'-diphospho)-2-C-methyl-D-erythritol kinase [Clostridia bacterium]|nr:4-(cytidine 5'-diphospho)-2-C-methyl-D-erythritol kinase [Clostridia bacterium]
MRVTEKAYAKINLFLDVLRRREDGFHDILSVMHSVSLADIINVNADYADQTHITITTDSQELSVDSSNLVYKAAEKYLNYFGIKANVSIQLEKNIPIGAGLGGGSSDAAATLRALNKVFHKADIDQLVELASELGSDVPFCILGGTSVCVDRGENFYQLPTTPRFDFVIAIGESRVSTPKAYASLDDLYNNFLSPRDPMVHGYAQRIGDMIENDTYDIPNYNIFEDVVKVEEILKIKEIMIKNEAEYALMSGSGPSVFGQFADSNKANNACDKLIEAGFTAFVCHSVYPEVDI